MAKAAPVTLDDLAPARAAQKPQSAARQRGNVPSDELVPLQFRLPPEFVREFKQAALDDDLKLNELMKACFHAFKQQKKNPS